MVIQQSDRFKMVVAVHLILRKESKILLGKRQNTGWADGQFHLFGGHVENREFVSNAVVREALEELGIKINPQDLELAHIRNILVPGRERLHFYFKVDRWEGQVTIREPELCSELAWFDVNKLPEHTTNDTLETLKMIEQKKYYSETDKHG